MQAIKRKRDTLCSLSVVVVVDDLTNSVVDFEVVVVVSVNRCSLLPNVANKI